MGRDDPRGPRLSAVAHRDRTLPPERVDEIVGRLDAGAADRADLKALTWHLLTLLTERAPGASVEVRVPPFAVIQCVAGSRHTTTLAGDRLYVLGASDSGTFRDAHALDIETLSWSPVEAGGQVGPQLDP